ncbi:hypothetical protein [Roseivirga sp. E12]|uniref:hypothetical protein n=1 Tax=Roseivirga sp. E12 TaxID=2819237 RepID=UPI001ABC24A9|nr:hypothetical protein [Roseivirga sp. E12]MBO3699627.1 hypothetical protein [Roseivirga sp. E12]
MKEFNLSDKELKALLQNEGMDEPSLSFNRNILEQIKKEEVRSTISIPLWSKIVFIILVLSPLAYLAFTTGDIDLGLQQLNEIRTPKLSLNLGLSSTYQYISLLAVAVIWMAFIFNRFLEQQNETKVKKG